MANANDAAIEILETIPDSSRFGVELDNAYVQVKDISEPLGLKDIVVENIDIILISLREKLAIQFTDKESLKLLQSIASIPVVAVDDDYI